MSKKVALIHTGFALVEVLKDLFREILPDVEVINIVDDSLLRDVLKKDKVDEKVTKRVCSYIVAAEIAGADVILNVCSSVSETVDVARLLVEIPIVKIDEPMAEEAVKKGTQIGVVATLATTLDPTIRLIERNARKIKREISIKRLLCEGAFDALMAGDSSKHDQIVLEGIRKVSNEVDLIVLAQGTMARLTKQLSPEIKVPVLSSPRSGIERVKEILTHTD